MRLTSAHRDALPTHDFAGPDRSYPINDPNHARNALSRVSQNGSPELQARVRAAVHSKYPGIGHRAMGGPVEQGQPYMVGERGPELMVPHSSGHILPHMGMRPPHAPRDPAYGQLVRAHLMRALGGR